MIKLFTVAAILVLSFPAFAQGAPQKPSQEPTRIEVDQEKGRILFFIAGELQAVLEKGRLTVEGDVMSDSYLHGTVDLQKQDREGSSGS